MISKGQETGLRNLEIRKIKTIQNNEKSPGELKRLAVT